MITKEQIKAGRAMLDWSQKTLAEQSGVSAPTIKLIEGGKINSTPDTLGTIAQTLENAGLEFLPQRGVRFRDDLITIIQKQDTNDNVFVKLLDDIYYTLKGTYGEILYSFVDNSLSPPEVTNRELLLRKEGITMRSLVRHGDTNLIYPLDEYRYLPKGCYANNPVIVYGKKFATVVKGNDQDGTVEQAIIIHNAAIAEIKRKEFDIIWSVGDRPAKNAGRSIS